MLASSHADDRLDRIELESKALQRFLLTPELFSIFFLPLSSVRSNHDECLSLLSSLGGAVAACGKALEDAKGKLDHQKKSAFSDPLPSGMLEKVEGVERRLEKVEGGRRHEQQGLGAIRELKALHIAHQGSNETRFRKINEFLENLEERIEIIELKNKETEEKKKKEDEERQKKDKSTEEGMERIEKAAQDIKRETEKNEAHEEKLKKLERSISELKNDFEGEIQKYKKKSEKIAELEAKIEKIFFEKRVESEKNNENLAFSTLQSSFEKIFELQKNSSQEKMLIFPQNYENYKKNDKKREEWEDEELVNEIRKIKKGIFKLKSRKNKKTPEGSDSESEESGEEKKNRKRNRKNEQKIEEMLEKMETVLRKGGREENDKLEKKMVLENLEKNFEISKMKDEIKEASNLINSIFFEIKTSKNEINQLKEEVQNFEEFQHFQKNKNIENSETLRKIFEKIEKIDEKKTEKIEELRRKFERMEIENSEKIKKFEENNENRNNDPKYSKIEELEKNMSFFEKLFSFSLLQQRNLFPQNLEKTLKNEKQNFSNFEHFQESYSPQPRRSFSDNSEKIQKNRETNSKIEKNKTRRRSEDFQKTERFEKIPFPQNLRKYSFPEKIIKSRFKEKERKTEKAEKMSKVEKVVKPSPDSENSKKMVKSEKYLVVRQSPSKVKKIKKFRVRKTSPEIKKIEKHAGFPRSYSQKFTENLKKNPENLIKKSASEKQFEEKKVENGETKTLFLEPFQDFESHNFEKVERIKNSRSTTLDSLENAEKVDYFGKSSKNKLEITIPSNLQVLENRNLVEGGYFPKIENSFFSDFFGTSLVSPQKNHTFDESREKKNIKENEKRNGLLFEKSQKSFEKQNQKHPKISGERIGNAKLEALKNRNNNLMKSNFLTSTQFSENDKKFKKDNNKKFHFFAESEPSSVSSNKKREIDDILQKLKANRKDRTEKGTEKGKTQNTEKVDHTSTLSDLEKRCKTLEDLSELGKAGKVRTSRVSRVYFPFEPVV